MSGYNTIRWIRELEQEVDELGLVITYPKNGYYKNEYGDVIALRPKDNNSLPVYSRDAEIFVGSLEELSRWIKGVKWARTYDQLLGLSNDEKRQRKEQDELNRHLVKRLKDEEIVTKK